MWWETLKAEIRDIFRDVLREELDARERLLSSAEVATKLTWSLDRWYSAVRRDPELAALAVPLGDHQGWPLPQVLDRLRQTGKLKGK